MPLRRLLAQFVTNCNLETVGVVAIVNRTRMSRNCWEFTGFFDGEQLCAPKFCVEFFTLLGQFRSKICLDSTYISIDSRTVKYTTQSKPCNARGIEANALVNFAVRVIGSRCMMKRSEQITCLACLRVAVLALVCMIMSMVPFVQAATSRSSATLAPASTVDVQRSSGHCDKTQSQMRYGMA